MSCLSFPNTTEQAPSRGSWEGSFRRNLQQDRARGKKQHTWSSQLHVTAQPAALSTARQTVMGSSTHLANRALPTQTYWLVLQLSLISKLLHNKQPVVENSSSELPHIRCFPQHGPSLFPTPTQALRLEHYNQPWCTPRRDTSPAILVIHPLSAFSSIFKEQGMKQPHQEQLPQSSSTLRLTAEVKQPQAAAVCLQRHQTPQTAPGEQKVKAEKGWRSEKQELKATTDRKARQAGSNTQ